MRQEFGKAEYPLEIEKNKKKKKVSVTPVGHLVEVGDIVF
jgi:hypothetical protein